MATPFTFEIVTPDKMLFSADNVTYVGFRSLVGGLGIKAKHLPIIATLDIASKNAEIDSKRASLALKRAITRLKVAQKA